VAAIAGAGVAAEHAAAALGQRASQAAKLQVRLLEGIGQAVEGVHLNGPEPGDGRLRHQLSLSTGGVEGEGQALMLDLRGVAIAAGAACTTRSMRMPPALRAIGRDADLAKGTTLWGIGRDNTEAEIDRAIELFAEVTSKLRSISPVQ
ncbi:MAG: aminotransferase class V-fold PLP-dependent enzyme, partial [Verrucomicrobia bacterium]|nr:aminotransferase class V-fold PLP-dependent enzyme [Verrucomicrobiota bacterium]